jgi:hypothetical protein
MQLIISQNSVFKPSGAQSSTLLSTELAPVAAGDTFEVLGYRLEGDHIVVTLDQAKTDLKALHPSGKNTWWIYSGHIEDPAGFSPRNNPRDTAPAAAPPTRDRGFQVELPGFAGSYWSNDPVSARAPNILWGEILHATSSGNYRKPESPEIVKRLIRIAEEAQKIRGMLGDRPMRVHSGYRDSVTNARVGGAKLSQHVQGGALDFSIPGVDVMTIYNKLNDSWPGGLAYSRSMGFVHIDIRNQGRARWAYTGG